MAEGKGQRKKQVPVRSAARAKVAVRVAPPTRDELQHECDRLRELLQVAQAEIETLRERQAAVVDRIDWVIDSLNSLPGSGT